MEEGGGGGGGGGGGVGRLNVGWDGITQGCYSLYETLYVYSTV